MKRVHFARFAILLVLIAASLAVPFQTPVASAVAQPSKVAAAGGTLGFDTYLSGQTVDQKYSVQIEVSKLSDTSPVSLTINLTSNGGAQNEAGSTYVFAVPSADMVGSANTYTLDTHKDLGKYGSVSATWTVSTDNQKTQKSDPCNTGSTVTYTVVTGSATVNLKFPCEGTITANLPTQSSEIDSGGYAGENTSTPSPFSSLNVSMAMAVKQKKSARVTIEGIKSGTMTLISVSSERSDNGTPLADETHFATDSLGAAGLTTTGNVTKLNYDNSSGLGTAHLTFTGTGQPFSMSIEADCIGGLGGKANKGKHVMMSTTAADVVGSVNMTACISAIATYVKGDTAEMMSFAPPGSKSTSMIKLPNGGGGGNCLGMMSKGDVCLASVKPADGASVSAGKPLSVKVTLTKAVTNAELMVTVTPPVGNPMPVQFSGKTASYTSSAPLTAGSYQLTIMVVDQSQGMTMLRETVTAK